MFYGSEVSVDWNADDGWKIYRFDDDGNVSQVILTTEAMNELRVYFAEDYATSLSDIASTIAAQREP